MAENTTSRVLYCAVNTAPKIVTKPSKLRQWLPPLSKNADKSAVVNWEDSYMCAAITDYIIIMPYEPGRQFQQYKELPINSSFRNLMCNVSVNVIDDPKGYTKLPENTPWRGEFYIVKMLPEDADDEIISDYNHTEFLKGLRDYIRD